MSNNSNPAPSTNDEDEDDDNFLRRIPSATIGSDYDSDDEDASDPFSRHVVPPIQPVTITDRHPDEVDMDVNKYQGNGGKSIRRRKSTKRRKTNRRRKSTKRRKTNRRRKHKGTRKRS